MTLRAQARDYRRDVEFTLAAERLGLQQSTISQQIKRLEAAVKRPLFRRDTHAVTLTSDGEALLDYARGILDLNCRIERHFSDIDIRGRLRVGISEDFAASRLPQVLRDFVAGYRGVDLELTVDISKPLYSRLDGGRSTSSSPSACAASDAARSPGRTTLSGRRGPTLASTRRRRCRSSCSARRASRARIAIDALEKADRTWIVACTSGSLFGLQAAALAGHCVMPFARSLLPSGLVPLSTRAGLPPLGRVEFGVIAARRHDRAATAIVDRLNASVDRFRDTSA